MKDAGIIQQNRTSMFQRLKCFNCEQPGHAWLKSIHPLKSYLEIRKNSVREKNVETNFVAIKIAQQTTVFCQRHIQQQIKQKYMDSW